MFGCTALASSIVSNRNRNSAVDLIWNDGLCVQSMVQCCVVLQPFRALFLRGGTFVNQQLHHLLTAPGLSRPEHTAIRSALHVAVGAPVEQQLHQLPPHAQSLPPSYGQFGLHISSFLLRVSSRCLLALLGSLK